MGHEAKSIREYLAKYRLGFSLPEMQILVGDGVYPPKLDSLLLAKQLADLTRNGDNVLEIGTGSGFLAILAAIKGANATATDIDEESVECTRHNGSLNRVTLDARMGDLFEPLRTGELFDLIVANVPTLPMPPEVERTEFVRKRINGGWDGRKYLDPLIEQAQRYMKSPAYLLTIHSNLANIELTASRLEQKGFSLKMVENEFAFSLGTQPREGINYALERLPPNCHPYKRGEEWYKRTAVFIALLR